VKPDFESLSDFLALQKPCRPFVFQCLLNQQLQIEPASSISFVLYQGVGFNYLGAMQVYGVLGFELW
jgi:hypothetical protein